MKKPLLITFILGLGLLTITARNVAYAADGDLDPTFDGDGMVTTNLTVADDSTARAISIQPDGKIVVAGDAGPNNSTDFALARYNFDGSLDYGFDGDGKVTTDFFGGSNDVGRGLAIQSDGKIVVAGHTTVSGNTDFALARYNPNGSLDYSFGGDGRVTTGFGSPDDSAYAVVIQPDGKIVAAGQGVLGGDFALVRYNSDGSEDTTFNGTGRVVTDFGGQDNAMSIKIQPDGKLVAAGASSNGDTAVALARYNPDGSLDTGFGANGKVISAISGTSLYACGVEIQSDGKIVAVGGASYGTGYDFLLMRYNSNGQLDPGFGFGGVVFTHPDISVSAQAVVIQHDGKIVAAGSIISSIGSFVLARYNPNGTLDNNFGGDGLVLTNFSGMHSAAYALTLQDDGKIVAAGSTVPASSSDNSFALARYDSSAPPAPTATPTAIPTSPVATPTSPSGCSIQFSDVPQGSTFYENVRCLACRGIISGYGDGTFRPGDPVTRGQLAKIVSNAAGFTENHTEQSFQDVAVGATFHQFVERLYSRDYISGYACGGVGEPCGSGNLPYFRPNANVTRGQTSKIVANAAGITDPAGTQAFEDVPPGSTFFDFVQRLANRNVMSGYTCGGPGEPCGSGNLPYFRPNSNVTRGQAAKIVANTFFPSCVTPGT